MIPEWNELACIGCVACVGICPVSALHFTGNRIDVNNETCIGCGECILICPVGALKEGGNGDA